MLISVINQFYRKNICTLSFALYTLGTYFYFLQVKKYSIISILLIFILGTITCYLAIIIHEIGHFIFGKSVRLHLYKMDLSIFTITIQKGNIHFAWNVEYGSSCLMYPRDTIESRRMLYIIYLLGGSLTNFIMAVACSVILYPSYKFKICEIFFVGLLYFNLKTFATNIIPNSKKNANDGRNILTILCDKTQNTLFHNQLLVRYYIFQGRDLKEYKCCIIDKNYKYESSLSWYNRYINYYIFLSKGDLKSALFTMINMYNLKKKYSYHNIQQILLEVLFITSLSNNKTLADEVRSQIKANNPIRNFDYWKGEFLYNLRFNKDNINILSMYRSLEEYISSSTTINMFAQISFNVLKDNCIVVPNQPFASICFSPAEK